MTLDDYFATGPARERPIFEGVLTRLDPLGPFVVEPVSVGILFKLRRVFVELRPKREWESLSFVLPRRVDHARITSHVGLGALTAHIVRVRTAVEVDDVLGAWLVESYLEH
jgi:hypothetical protein